MFGSDVAGTVEEVVFSRRKDSYIGRERECGRDGDRVDTVSLRSKTLGVAERFRCYCIPNFRKVAYLPRDEFTFVLDG